MRAEGGKKGKGKRREKKRKKEEKMGIKFFFYLFFLSVHAQVFSYAQWSFFKYIRKTVFLDLADHIRFCLRSSFSW